MMDDMDNNGFVDPDEMSAARKALKEQQTHEVKGLQRDCFSRLLIDYLGCAPSMRSIEVFAERYPDRYFAALGIISQLAGYKKDVNVSHSHTLIVANMADSNLYAELKATEIAWREAVQLKQISHKGQSIESSHTVQRTAQDMESLSSHRSRSPRLAEPITDVEMNDDDVHPSKP